MSETLRLWQIFWGWWLTKWGVEPSLDLGTESLNEWTTFLAGQPPLKNPPQDFNAAGDVKAGDEPAYRHPPLPIVGEVQVRYMIGEPMRARHHCGLSGYDGMKDPPCPACVERSKQIARYPVVSRKRECWLTDLGNVPACGCKLVESPAPPKLSDIDALYDAELDSEVSRSPAIPPNIAKHPVASRSREVLHG